MDIPISKAERLALEALAERERALAADRREVLEAILTRKRLTMEALEGCQITLTATGVRVDGLQQKADRRKR